MKLLVLVACDKALQDPQYGNSLISIFHGIKFAVPRPSDLPADAVAPKEWAIFSKWELLPEEQNKPYVSAVEIFWPNGEPFLPEPYRLQAAMPTLNGMAFNNRMNGFPVGQPGRLKVLQTLELEGESVYGPIELEIDVAITPLTEIPSQPVKSESAFGS